MPVTLSRYFKSIAISLLVLTPLITFFSPRLMAYLPAIMGLFACLSLYLRGREWPCLPRHYLMAILPVLGLAFASALWSDWPEMVIERTGKLALVLGFGAMFLSFPRLLTRDDLNKIGRLLVVTLITSAVLGVLELSAQNTFLLALKNIDMEHLKTGAYMNRGIIVFFFCAIFTFALIETGDHSRKYKVTALSLLSLCCVALLMVTDSQSVQLGALMAMVGFLVCPVKSCRLFAVFGVLFAALIFAAPFGVQYVFEHFAANIGEIGWFQQGYAPHRLEIWDFVSRYALQSPLYGHGIEAVRMVEAFDSKMLFHVENHVLHPHNFAVQLWAEFGILGAVLGSMVIAVILSAIHRMAADTPAALITKRTSFALFMMALSIAATGYGLWQSWWIGCFILIAGLAMILGHMTMAAAQANDGDLRAK